MAGNCWWMRSIANNTAKIAAGTLASIDNQIDMTTGTYKLKATFKNEDNVLFPNQFVNVHLLVDTKRNLDVVPDSRNPARAARHLRLCGGSATTRPRFAL